MPLSSFESFRIENIARTKIVFAQKLLQLCSGICVSANDGAAIDTQELRHFLLCVILQEQKHDSFLRRAAT